MLISVGILHKRNQQSVATYECVRHLTLCNPEDCSPLGSSVHGISQARLLKWVPFPPPGHLPDPGIQPASPTSPNSAKGRFFNTEPSGKPLLRLWFHHDLRILTLSLCVGFLWVHQNCSIICCLVVPFSDFRKTTRGCFVAQS